MPCTEFEACGRDENQLRVDALALAGVGYEANPRAAIAIERSDVYRQRPPSQ